MTLFKQMAIAISLIIVLLLATVMMINYNSSKSNMLQSLYETTVNNISNLADKIAQSGGEEAYIINTINSEFDSGYYKQIEFKSNDGATDYKQVDERLPDGVPLWFIKFTNLHIESVKADVTSGWDMIGTVRVVGDSNVIYIALYKLFLNLSYLFAISVFVSLIILYVILHFVLKPLKSIQKQAEAIMKNEFLIQEGEPFTTEFKDVVSGMNAMVHKVEDIFKKGNEAIQRNRELLYNDSATKLYNRRYLMLKLSDLIAQNNSISGGSSLFFSISSLELLVKDLGYQKSNDFLLELSDILKKSIHKYEDSIVARTNQTDFTLIVPECESNSALEIAQSINEKWNELEEKFGIDANEIYINIGIFRYFVNTSITELLTNTDSALLNAKASEKSNIYIFSAENIKQSLGKEEWRALLEDAMENNRFNIIFRKTVDAKEKRVIHNTLSFTMNDKSGNRYFYGDFIAAAINLNIVSEIYTHILKDLMTQKLFNIRGELVSINLSSEFLKDPHAYNQLSTLLKSYAKEIDFDISFEISDSFTIKNLDIVKNFVSMFKKYNYQFGLNSYTGESYDVDYLKELHPKFIKSDKSYLLDQSDDSMNALQLVTDSLGIKIIASFVKDEEELEKLKRKHVHLIQGPIVDTLIK
jgi:diguanylate cyclase (GGDEF)-like protein